MTDAVSIAVDPQSVTAGRVSSGGSDTNVVNSSIIRRTSSRSSQTKSMTNLQPSVEDASGDDTPIPTPLHNYTQSPFNADHHAVENERQTSGVSHTDPPPKQPPDRAPTQTSQQPPHTWYQDPSSQTWQSTASPPQSPVIHQYGGFQTPGQLQYPYDYSYAYAPQIATGPYQPYNSPYYPMPFSPPADAGPPPMAEHRTSRSGSGDEHDELMTRIQSVLPDLSRLLEQYREGQAPQVAPTMVARQAQTEQNDQLTNLQQELDATKKEYERVIRKLVDENCTLKNEAKDQQRRSRSHEGDSRGTRKLKVEYETLQAQHQDLASSVDSIRLSKEELMAEKLGVEKHVESLKKDKHIIKDSHHRTITDLKAQHLEELTLKDNEHQKALAEHKSGLNKVQLDLATLISKHNATKRDLEHLRNSEALYKASSEASSRDLDSVRAQHTRQLDKLKADNQRVVESLKQEHKTQRQRHENETKLHISELEVFRTKEKDWATKIQSLNSELEALKEAHTAEREAHAKLRNINEERNRRTADLAGSMASWRQKYAKLQEENENLDRAINALGFGSIGVVSGQELEQAEPPAVDLNNELNNAGDALHKADTPTKATQEPITGMGEEGKTLAREPAQQQERGKDPVAETDTAPLEEPVKSPERPKEADVVAKAATTAPAVEAPLPVDVEGNPNERLTPSPTQVEKAVVESDAAVQSLAQPADGPITFRPIHYYQIPGQYQ